MSKSNFYSKPILFSVMAFIAIAIGSVVTMLVPLARSEMHPRLENLEPYTAIQLAGRDVYQREGCFNCHSQNVRPLKADVLRYGDYSKAGEFADDRPFLWGSRRTGPDLARVGNKYPDEWHKQHLNNPQFFYSRSNMPKYDWLEKTKLNPNAIKASMNGLGFPYTDSDIEALKDKTEMDAMVAYLQYLGSSVEFRPLVTITEEDFDRMGNPATGKPDAVAMGKQIYMAECAACHGAAGEGNIGLPLADYADGMDEKAAFLAIANGVPSAMPSFIVFMTTEQIGSVVEYIKTLKPDNQ